MTQEELGLEIRKMCESKAGEFRLMGLADACADDVWSCVFMTKRESMDTLHGLANAVLSLKNGAFEAWRGAKASQV